MKFSEVQNCSLKECPTSTASVITENEVKPTEPNVAENNSQTSNSQLIGEGNSNTDKTTESGTDSASETASDSGNGPDSAAISDDSAPDAGNDRDILSYYSLPEDITKKPVQAIQRENICKILKNACRRDI